MNKVYYETLGKMEKQGVDAEYINGWVGGFLHHPKREEQRLNAAYEAGYKDGFDGNTAGFGAWAGKK